MNRLFTVLLSILLLMPIATYAEDSAMNTYKQPISKRKIVKKFIFAMGGVAISSLSIFFLLTVYNRARGYFLHTNKFSENEVFLGSPGDLNGALKAFLEKTDWK